MEDVWMADKEMDRVRTERDPSTELLGLGCASLPTPESVFQSNSSLNPQSAEIFMKVSLFRQDTLLTPFPVCHGGESANLLITACTFR